MASTNLFCRAALASAAMLNGLLLAAPAYAQPRPDLATVLAEIDQGFVCPQFLPDDAARRAEMLAFSRALASIGPPRITYRQAAYIRTRMLERHNCGGSATTVASAESADGATAGDAPASAVPTATPN